MYKHPLPTRTYHCLKIAHLTANIPPGERTDIAIFLTHYFLRKMLKLTPQKHALCLFAHTQSMGNKVSFGNIIKYVCDLWFYELRKREKNPLPLFFSRVRLIEDFSSCNMGTRSVASPPPFFLFPYLHPTVGFRVGVPTKTPPDG